MRLRGRHLLPPDLHGEGRHDSQPVSETALSLLGRSLPGPASHREDGRLPEPASPGHKQAPPPHARAGLQTAGARLIPRCPMPLGNRWVGLEERVPQLAGLSERVRLIAHC